MLTGRRRVVVPDPCGFTLVELLAALAVIGILFATALPSWASFLAERGLRERAGALTDSFLTARTEAVRHGGRVGVCPRAVDRCDPGASGWERGWIVFVDDNRNGLRDAGERVVAREGAAPEGVTIRGNRPVNDYVSYTSAGQLRRIDGALQMGSFVVCRSGYAGLKVVLANGGRVRTTDTGGACP